MSWRLILSEYPESLFCDSSPLVVLAMLERSGAQTEDDLANKTKTEKALLARILLALYRDRCIEYTRDFVNITERGRDFIDRLALQEEIIDDLLNDLRIPAAEHQQIRDVLLKYRSRSFQRYLDSINAIRTWDTACHTQFLGAIQEEENARESGAIAILLRDLRKWIAASGETSEKRDISTAYNSIKQKLILGGGGMGKSVLALRMQKPSTWLDAYDELGRADDPWENLRKLNSPHLVVFLVHEYSRDLLDDMNTWVYNWTAPKGEWTTVLESCRSMKDFFTIAQTHGKIAIDLGMRPCTELIQRETGFEQVLRQNVGELFTHILYAQSISDLAQRLNCDQSALQQILERIQSRCDILLNKGEPNPNAPPGQIKIETRPRKKRKKIKM